MINGVLIEKTVKDVTPALETNSEGLKKVLEELVKQYKRQQEDMEKWKVSSYHFGFYHYSYDGYTIFVSKLSAGPDSIPSLRAFADECLCDAEEKQHSSRATIACLLPDSPI